MRFLVLTSSTTPPPPELIPDLIAAERGWRDRHRDRIESYGWFVGDRGGFGVVAGDDELVLAQMVAEHPFTPFTRTELRLIADADPVGDVVLATLAQRASA
jgi:hypothetical protein